MFSIGHDELEKKPNLGKSVTCKSCGLEHPVKYGDRILSDGSHEPDTLLAFYSCGDKAYLAGIGGKAI